MKGDALWADDESESMEARVQSEGEEVEAQMEAARGVFAAYTRAAKLTAALKVLLAEQSKNCA